MDTRRVVAIVLGIAVLIGGAIAVLASRAFDVARQRAIPLEPVPLVMNGDIGSTIATRPIAPVLGGPTESIRPLVFRLPSEPGAVAQPPAFRAPPRPVPVGPAAPPAARAAGSCVAELGLPATFMSDGRPSDAVALAAADTGGGLHLGVGAVGSVWNESFTFAPSLTDALALAWAGIRYGVNPNALAAFAIKESRYDCSRYGDGCFQIAAPTFAELQRQFPRTLGALGHASAVRDPRLAPQVAALHFALDEFLFRVWYPWDSFHARARDANARLKLLARAYNRGAWDTNIRDILTRDADRCAAADDLLSCFDSHAGARDHAASITAYATRLATLPAYDRTISWNDLHTFLDTGARPFAAGEDWPRLLTIAHTGYDCLVATQHHFTYRAELPRLLTWLAAALPPPESPQATGDYRAPVSTAPAAPVASSPGATNAFHDDFSRDLNAWTTAFTGFGTVGIRDGALRLAPAAATRPEETHAALVTARGLDRDTFTFAFRTRTLRQLRTGSSPNPWEVGWVLFHYRDLQHYDYLILKTNGVELGKKQGSDQQIFLETRAVPALTLGAWTPVVLSSEVLPNGSRRIRATVNGIPAIDHTDRDPLHGGTVALYTEDADVAFDDVAVEQ